PGQLSALRRRVREGSDCVGDGRRPCPAGAADPLFPVGRRDLEVRARIAAASLAGRTASRGGVSRRPVHSVAQLLSGSEEKAALWLDRDHLAGLRVTTLISLIILHVEGAQSPNLDVLSPAERLLHGIEDSLDGRLCLLLRDTALGDENVDQVRLEHSLLLEAA